MKEKKTFRVDYYQRVKGVRSHSHSYVETWEPRAMHCPHCGKDEVWCDAGGGDYYVGNQHMCAACGAAWTIQGPYPPGPSDDQGLQRLAAITGRSWRDSP